ncbi:TniQ family protein [Photobacterium aquimaris]|uniref:TniQ domain-containing protein n=1 Tax=Photobacterium aquimaris TaxID=512643 RepID=A0A2T3HVS4_9GAMM|nr:TniQ family protein [Photobacterium aquimaris]OBU20675.1 hypothetical protein AYY21_17660 [Photobacterium aquimaris]PQJ37427.1 hypothetical protein BTN98_16805 [Photobacterium aquimaris]PSU02755.1 hypothetical protein C0W81_13680 [Photobacterium aquimaris]
MINYKDNESLHSYFLRILQLNGEISNSLALKGIVGINGRIKLLPVANNAIKRQFEVDISCLYPIIKEHMISQKLAMIYFDELVEYVLSGINVSDKKFLTPVVDSFLYCPICFQEQINRDGFAWFKREWLLSKYCIEHKLLLFHVYGKKTSCCSASFNIYEGVLSALSGKCFTCRENYWGSDCIQLLSYGDKTSIRKKFNL